MFQLLLSELRLALALALVVVRTYVVAMLGCEIAPVNFVTTHVASRKRLQEDIEAQMAQGHFLFKLVESIPPCDSTPFFVYVRRDLAIFP